MEPFVDFGLFELVGVLALLGLSHAARRRVRRRLQKAAAKLGRCVRCMTVSAIGLGASALAVLWLGPGANPFVAVPVYVVVFGFAVLSALHVVAMLYRALARLETNVARKAGGCNCTASRIDR